MKMRETDINISLPELGDALPGTGNGVPLAVEITTDAKGRITIPKQGGMLDMDSAARDLPLLRGFLEKDLRVTIRADADTSQQRLTDVLKPLSQRGAISITFADWQAKKGMGITQCQTGGA